MLGVHDKSGWKSASAGSFVLPPRMRAPAGVEALTRGARLTEIEAWEEALRPDFLPSGVKRLDERTRGVEPARTARSRFGQPAPGLAFPESLRAAVREYDLPSETVALAWEIARLARNIAPEEGEALLVLALATLVAARQGSTRVPLPGAPEDEGPAPYLDTLAQRFGLAPEQRAAFAALLAAARRRTEPGGGVLGVPGITPRSSSTGRFSTSSGCCSTRTVRGRSARGSAETARGCRRKAEAAIADLLARPPEFAGVPVALSDEQQAAVGAALGSALTVVSGGPGPAKRRSCFRSCARSCGSACPSNRSRSRRRPARPPTGSTSRFGRVSRPSNARRFRRGDSRRLPQAPDCCTGFSASPPRAGVFATTRTIASPRRSSSWTSAP